MVRWIRAPLGELTSKIGSGATPLGGEAAYKAHGISLIRSLNVHDGEFRRKDLAFLSQEQADRLANVVVQPNDVLLNITGASVARCCTAPDEVLPARVNQHVAIIRPHPNRLSPRFLQYLLVSSEYKNRLLSAGEGAGATRQALTKAQLQSFLVEFPESLQEQARIVANLDEAFEGIATAKANAEKNLQSARELPGVAMRRALASGAASWVESTIGDQVSLQRGFDITKDQQREGTVPVVSSGGIRSYHDTPMVQAPGVVMGRKGTLGKVYYLEEDFWPHDTTLWVKDFKGNDPRFVYRYFEVLDVHGLDSGAANPALNRNQVHPLRVLWPPLDEQRALAKRIELLSAGADQLASTYGKKLVALDELWKSLLHQAFTGALTAKSTDEHLEAVA